MTKIQTAINYVKNIALDDSHGYDQSRRWGDPDYDCSSLVISAWDAAGVPVKKNGATYTGNMYTSFLKSGFSDVTSDVDIRTGAGLLPGDVCLNRVHHTVLYIGDGKVVTASGNERGKARGGKPGDQTGKEIYIRNYYNYPWDYILRYAEKNTLHVVRQSDKFTVARQVIRGEYGNGSERIRRLRLAGYDPQEIQNLVNYLLAK